MLTTSAITATLLSPNNSAIAGARITATLTQMDTAALSGMVFPREVEAVTNEDGQAILNLWPNTEGVTGSQYRFRAWHPETGRKLLDELATVPNHDANLRDILLLPAPTRKPYDEASIAAIQQARAQAVDAASEAQGYLQAVSSNAQAAQQAANDAHESKQKAAAAAAAANQDRLAAEQAVTVAAGHADTALQKSGAAESAASSAADAQQAAEQARDTASGHSLTAFNRAEDAAYSANQAAIARHGIEALRDESASSAQQAVLARTSAEESMRRANEYKVSSSIYKNLANNYAQQSKEHRDKAKAYRESARRWAQEHEYTPVINEDGEVPQYSAMHWALQALKYALGGGIDDTQATPSNVWSAFKTKERIEQERDRALAAEQALESQLDDKVDKIEGFGLSQSNYTPAEKEKLAGLESSRFKGQFTSVAALEAALPTGEAGDYANVDLGAGNDVVRYIWDTSDGIWVEQLGISSQLTGAQIKQEYEAQPDTNAFTDADRIKLDGIQAEATKNATNAQLRDRSTHTGEQEINTIVGLREELDSKVDKVFGKQLSTEDFTTPLKEKLSNIEPEANNYQHPATHPAEMIEQSEQQQFASQAEKDAWNAKETPQGAQQKATQAKADAKEYADQTFIEKTKRGAPNGVASLDSLGRVPQSQLPPNEATQVKSNAVAMAIVFGA